METDECGVHKVSFYQLNLLRLYVAMTLIYISIGYHLLKWGSTELETCAELCTGPRDFKFTDQLKGQTKIEVLTRKNVDNCPKRYFCHIYWSFSEFDNPTGITKCSDGTCRI